MPNPSMMPAHTFSGPAVSSYSEPIRALVSKIIRGSATKPSKRWGEFWKEVDPVAMGERLRRLREKYGVQSKAVAAKLNFTAPTVCNMEKGRFNWNAEKILAFVQAIIDISNENEKNGK